MITMMKSSQRGFTLVELMIAVAIMGILAAVAYPSYVSQVRKAKRSDAFVALNEMAQRQERYFLLNRSYAKGLTTAAGELGYGTTSPQGLYTLSVAALDAGGGACTGLSADACVSFTLSATPVTGSPQASDSACKTITLDNRGTKAAKDSSNAASTVCW